MSHYIVKVGNEYMYHRRSTGHMYVNRTMWGPNIEEARVFTQKTAAKNAANSSLKQGNYHTNKTAVTRFKNKDYEVVEVGLVEKR